MSNLLRNSLQDMYRGDMVVLELLAQLDLTVLENNFLREVYARIPKEDFLYVQEILNSDLVKQYELASQCAVLALTKQISDMLELVLLPNDKGIKGIN